MFYLLFISVRRAIPEPHLSSPTFQDPSRLLRPSLSVNLFLAEIEKLLSANTLPLHLSLIFFKGRLEGSFWCRISGCAEHRELESKLYAMYLILSADLRLCGDTI